MRVLVVLHSYTHSFRKVERSIVVDFNALDAVINLQTWVVVFEFFGIGVPKPPPSQPVSPVPSDGGLAWKEGGEQGMNRVRLRLTGRAACSVMLTLSKWKYRPTTL